MRLTRGGVGVLLPAAMLLFLTTCQSPAPAPPAEFVGRQACASCHPRQTASWRGSHHDWAMREARPDTVLGDFDNATFSHAGAAENDVSLSRSAGAAENDVSLSRSAGAAENDVSLSRSAEAAENDVSLSRSAGAAENDVSLSRSAGAAENDVSLSLTSGGASFSHAGVSSRFFRRDGKFWVATDGPDGSPREYEIAYTFGIEPLQQYLIRFPGGRLQALGVAWDARTKAEGGQRWFHLYGDEPIDHRDLLHWTGPYQNWNHMCAECHSTGIRKNYQPETRTFATTWEEINVSCEACHGPGSRHVAWAEKGWDDPTKGWEARIGDQSPARWVIDPATETARRDPTLPGSSNEVETCAPCHSRRETLDQRHAPGLPLTDSYAPSLLTGELYFPDGQIRDEVYEYGSFLQSKMYARGVTCGDCHDPHSLKPLRPKNALCTICHLAKRFDSRTHHRHAPGSPGSRCVDCHMPERVYMQIDRRRDHSFRVPRPDLSVKLGTPHPCAACHGERGDAWAAAQVAGWLEAPPPEHYGEVLDAGRRREPDAAARLERLVLNARLPVIVRATALRLLGEQPSPPDATVLRAASEDADPLLRKEAAGLLARLPFGERFNSGAALLEDPVLIVRLEAARVLASAPKDQLPARWKSTLERAVAEYRGSLRLHADRPEARLNLAALAASEGRVEEAEAEYREAIRLVPAHPAAYVNLADLLRARDRDPESETVLRDGLRLGGDNPELRHSLGLLLVRNKRPAEALAELRRAVELRTENPRYAYVYAVALQSSGRLNDSLSVLESARRFNPRDPELLVALATFHQLAGDREAALRHARQLAALYPDQEISRRLLRELEPR